MKYLLLIYEDDADRVANMEERMPTCAAYAEAMKKAGIYVDGNRLRAVSSATIVRVVDGKTHVVDGPYADSARSTSPRGATRRRCCNNRARGQPYTATERGVFAPAGVGVGAAATTEGRRSP